MDKKLRIAVIGTGGMGCGVHLPAWANCPEAEIVALCDIKKEKAEAMAEKYNVPAERVFEDYKQLLQLPDLDAVDICTPNYLHSVITVDALQAGKHVFTEKPDAVSVAEAERMKAAAEQSGKVLMTMRNCRFMANAVWLKKYIDDGKMGEIYAARCGIIRRRGVPGKGGWFTTKALSGGGPLIDLGVHMIDLSMYLMGNPKPVAVSGCTYRKFAESDISDSVDSAFGEKKDGGVFDVEDLAMGFIRFDNGACMQIEFSWASNIAQEQKFFELRGVKSGAAYTSIDEKLRIYTEAYGSTVDYLPNIEDHGPGYHAANILHFVDVVLHGAEPIFVPEQGVNMIKILQAIYESAETGREVRL